MAKARAYLSGRDYVVPQDIKDVFVDVCAHRVILTPKARIKKISAQTVLSDMLGSITAPSPAK